VLYLIFLILLIAMVCGVISLVSNKNKQAKIELENARKLRAEASNSAQLSNQQVQTEHDEAWNTLIKYDDEMRAAYEKVSMHGDAAVAELKQAYKVMGDKSKMPQVADQIVADIESGTKVEVIPSSTPSSGSSGAGGLEYQGYLIKPLDNGKFEVDGKTFASQNDAQDYVEMMKWNK